MHVMPIELASQSLSESAARTDCCNIVVACVQVIAAIVGGAHQLKLGGEVPLDYKVAATVVHLLAAHLPGPVDCVPCMHIWLLSGPTTTEKAVGATQWMLKFFVSFIHSDIQICTVSSLSAFLYLSMLSCRVCWRSVLTRTPSKGRTLIKSCLSWRNSW